MNPLPDELWYCLTVADRVRIRRYVHECAMAGIAPTTSDVLLMLV